MEGWKDCFYVNDGKGNAGRLDCGTEEQYDLTIASSARIC